MNHPLSKTIRALEWTQAELARRSGVVQPTISNVLAGKRGGKFSPKSARKILDAVRLGGRCRAEPSARNAAAALKLEDLVYAPAA